MSNPLPDLLALTSIADGSQRLAAPLRNNYNAIQAAMNELLAALNAGVAGQMLQSGGAAALQWGPKITTSTLAAGPPAAPLDQDIWVATAVDASGTRWMFQYNAGSASAFKWEFVGGGVLKLAGGNSTYTSGVNAIVYTNSGLILPRAGDYSLDAEIMAQNNTAVNPAAVTLQLGIGGVSLGRQAAVMLPNGGNITSAHISDDAIGAAASANVQIGVNAPNQPWTISQAVVRAIPRRIS